GLREHQLFLPAVPRPLRPEPAGIPPGPPGEKVNKTGAIACRKSDAPGRRFSFPNPFGFELVLFVVLAVVLDGGGSAAVGRHILLKAGEFLLGRPPADQDQAGVVAPGFPGGTAGAAFGL